MATAADGAVRGLWPLQGCDVLTAGIGPVVAGITLGLVRQAGSTSEASPGAPPAVA